MVLLVMLTTNMIYELEMFYQFFFNGGLWDEFLNVSQKQKSNKTWYTAS